MLHLFITLCFSLSLAVLENQSGPTNFLSNQYISDLNSKQHFWRAGRNFDPDTSLRDIKTLLGELDSGVPLKSTIKASDPKWPSDDKIPANFDARLQWKRECPKIAEVLDQGHCGSCWAVSSSSAATDRHCIQSKGKIQIRFSANHIAACCHKCGHACNGGKTYRAWDFYQRHGLITGGNWNSSEGCQPYSVEPCAHHGSNSAISTPRCKDLPDVDLKCSTECTNENYQTPFGKDKHKNKDSYILTDEKSIQKDILAHGPMTLSFTVYSDFPHYKSGVYITTSNAVVRGRHAVKVIGWGTEKHDGREVPYWLIINSWNEQWGDKGLFKILRGSNHCGIEERALGGVPRKY